MNRYISITLPFPDAQMSVLLCGPCGAVTYKVKEEMKDTVTDEFILQLVAPSIAAVFGNKVGLLLGRALLWAAVDFPSRVTTRVKSRILTRLAQVTGDAEINLIV